MSNYYIGLMSGTSMDGIDCALVEFKAHSFTLMTTYSHPIPSALKQDLAALSCSGLDEINRCGQLDREMGILFADSCLRLLDKAHISPSVIAGIGSHGQTIRHQPHLKFPFTLQIGDPNIIAEYTGITTVADFRRRDMAAGGQGAPLTPAFHHYAFYSEQEDRTIVNIGGIANITYLPSDSSQHVIGFDTGPGNTLLDSWIKLHINESYDADGAFAHSGKVYPELLQRCLADPYISQPPPKSIGKEYFNLDWLSERLSGLAIEPNDVQATLAEFTALSILRQISTAQSRILVCGGGAHNQDLMARLRKHAGDLPVTSTQVLGVDPDWVEAIAFAWFAKRTLAGLTSNLPDVTGANKECILGGIYPGRY